MKKLPDKIRRVGLVANPDKVNCRPAVQKAAALITEAGRLVLSDKPTADLAGLKAAGSPDTRQLTRQADLILVFGGDGTMLRVAREAAGSNTPILGINVGGLGFLTAVSSEQLPRALACVWSGDFAVEPRSLIEAAGQVSSPTGSTAYSLAAGGAIVSPNAEVFTLTPICPHTLSNRSVIVSLNSVVRVRVLSRKVETILSADGQVQTQLSAGDIVEIRRSQRGVRLLRLSGSSFFETLRQKLHWSGSNV